jgi:threonine aldolase
MPRVIDLRSDTVTRPTPGMREAIARAEVGDDVYGEDPTVNRLEARAAEMLGMEAAVLTASGTMANLLALLTHCGRGRKALVGDQSDLWRWEACGASVLGGVAYHPIATSSSGELAIADIEAAIDDPTDAQCALPAVLCLETTHALAGGRALPLSYLAEARACASRLGLRLHLDGARIFNAAAALGVPARAIAGTADTVSFCLSKGLGAPVGSLLAGAADAIAEARRLRKMLGGGMRQAGIIAAAGLYALEHGIDRLADDHATARLLAEGLRDVPGLVLDTSAPQTNIVYWRLADAAWPVRDFLDALEQEGVRAMEVGAGRVRVVTHLEITPDDIPLAVASVRRAVDRMTAARGSHAAAQPA